MNFSLPEKATAVDLDNNGYVDHVYVGDVGGQLWKFDVSATATTSWTGKRLFVAVPTQANPPAAGEFFPAQAFFGAPSLALAPDWSLWVFIGTGDRYHPNSAASNRFYGIKDNTTMANGSFLTESNLADVTTTNGTGANGWFIQLANANEKVLAAPNVFNGQVIFTSFTPTTAVSCTSGSGTARLYDVQMLTGYAAVNFSTGLALTSTDASSARSTVIGQGIPSMPIIVVTPPTTPGAAATSSVIVSTTNQQLPNNAIPAPGFLKQIRAWRERFQ
jgi:type IV pilus assembly protein PilY1